MIKHIVMWKLKEHAEGANKEKNAQKIKSMLEGLKDQIKEIVKIEAGINFNPLKNAYDVALYSVFQNQNDFEIYRNHPEHLKIAEFIGKVCLDRCIADYEH